MKRIRFIVSLLLILAASQACFKVETIPARPNIEFTSFEIFDTLDILDNISKAGRLLFRFEDGDGNVGLSDPVGSEEELTNMQLSLFRKINGSMERVKEENDPMLPFSSYRIPYMERLGQNKILRGTIAITFIYSSYLQGDTIKYQFFIKDRANNISNVAETAEIIVAENKIYTK
jgi:hypothetical protein